MEQIGVRSRIWLACLLCVVLVAFVLGCGGKEPGSPSAPTSTPTAEPAGPEAAPLSDSDAETVDITASGAYARTWVTRVKQCDVTVSDSSLVCEVVGSSDTSGGQYGGVRVKIGSVKAVRVDVTFTNPENISGVFMDLTVGEKAKQRVRWELAARGGQRPPSGEQSFTFRPNESTDGFQYEGGPATIDEVDHAQFFIRLKPNSTAGFHIHRMLVER